MQEQNVALHRSCTSPEHKYTQLKLQIRKNIQMEKNDQYKTPSLLILTKTDTLFKKTTAKTLRIHSIAAEADSPLRGSQYKIGTLSPAKNHEKAKKSDKKNKTGLSNTRAHLCTVAIEDKISNILICKIHILFKKSKHKIKTQTN